MHGSHTLRVVISGSSRRPFFNRAVHRVMGCGGSTSKTEPVQVVPHQAQPLAQGARTVHVVPPVVSNAVESTITSSEETSTTAPIPLNLNGFSDQSTVPASGRSSPSVKSLKSFEQQRGLHTGPSADSDRVLINSVNSLQIQQERTMSAQNVKYETVEHGSLYNLDYRVYYKGPQGLISPWHDIPLFADKAKGIYNMIVEIPRWSNAKMEMATKEPFSPIKQDEKKGKARFVHNIFPHKGYIWNYGALPQTWEDPNHVVPDTGAGGDNDPIDVIEIGSKVAKRGAVLQVKVLGTLALLDEGETDWKVVAIDVNDELAPQLNDIGDVEKHLPGLLANSVEWFRLYKIPAGKPANEFAFNGEFKNKEYAEKVIAETADFWQKLIKEASPKLNTVSRVPEAAHQATDELANQVLSSAAPHGADAALPADVDKWHFVKA